MKQTLFLLALTLLGGLSIGCGSQSGGGSPQAAAPASGDAKPATEARAAGQAAAAGTSSAAVPADLGPQEVVARFLDSLRSGDEAIAAELLTTKARTETARHDLTVQPPGTPQATYRVGQVEYVTEKRDGAHVTSTWSEPTGGGGHESYEIVWVLRLQPHGWRIAGMATQVVPNQAPLFLNFEDPADMLQKWQDADAELASQNQQPAAQQASQPAGPGAVQQR
ncbi:MAG: hypothetical protein J5I93_27015 [Pirellulaceae bacterium]|nr:hypothetical protein [Pirellulaceae bacterium]